MRPEKSDFSVYTSLAQNSDPRTTNITDLLRRNKAEQKKEKIIKIYTIVGFSGLALVFGIFVVL